MTVRRTIVLVACAAWMTACAPADGAPLHEMPAWAALALGVLEALVFLGGLAAAVWLLTRSPDDGPGRRRP